RTKSTERPIRSRFCYNGAAVKRASWSGIGYTALGSHMPLEEDMKKTTRRGKSKTSSKRAPVGSKIKKMAAKARTKLARARSAVRPSSKARTRVKRVAKRAATAAVVAAGTAALGTAVAELGPDRSDSKKQPRNRSNPSITEADVKRPPRYRSGLCDRRLAILRGVRRVGTGGQLLGNYH